MKNFHILFLLGVLLLSACAPTATPIPQVPQPTIEPTKPPSQPPDGAYSVTITTEELKSQGWGDEFLVCENAGTLTLTAAGDKWSISQIAAPGCTLQNATLGGTWKFSGDQVKFHDDNPFGCGGDYTYKWVINGTNLSFTSVDDKDCPPRVYFMSKHPWVKK